MAGLVLTGFAVGVLCTVLAVCAWACVLAAGHDDYDDFEELPTSEQPTRKIKRVHLTDGSWYDEEVGE